jgi:tripartite-type tricarboxylate transporter receptor subunit TctC
MPHTNSTASTCVAVAALVSCLIGMSAANAQEYPTRPITIVVPFAAGGPTDEAAREVGQRMSKSLGQNVIIENVSGGATNIGIGRVARSAPDGYTLLLHQPQVAVNVTLYPKIGFDIQKDLTIVGLVNATPVVLVGRKSLPPDNLAELKAWMKDHTVKFALPGIGTNAHLTTVALLNTLGVEADLVPYRGAAPVMQDLLGEHVDLFIAAPTSVLELLGSKMLKAYGVTSKDRLGQIPDVPSLVGELGPQMEALFWHGLFARAGTPEPVIRKLSAALQEATADPSLVKSWAALGISPFRNEMATPDGGQKFFLGEVRRWGDIIRRNKIEVQN